MIVQILVAVTPALILAAFFMAVATRHDGLHRRFYHDFGNAIMMLTGFIVLLAFIGAVHSQAALRLQTLLAAGLLLIIASVAADGDPDRPRRLSIILIVLSGLAVVSAFVMLVG